MDYLYTGESKIITAQAEVESAKLMREASDILNTPAGNLNLFLVMVKFSYILIRYSLLPSPSAMQIRYLETLQSMSKQAGTKVIFMPGTSGSGQGQISIEKAHILEHMGV